jgi:hypothetical protein
MRWTVSVGFCVLPFALALPPGWEPTVTVMMAPSAGGTCGIGEFNGRSLS